jgi:serine phosphatase RsbU (regulator of sigma subunit)
MCYLEMLGAERTTRIAQQEIAETLQRSLLPDLPVLPGMTCAARYLAGTDGAHVGGDWYDVFALPDGAVGLAVGDVMGHDVQAAAAMGQLRSVLRSYAYEGGSPSSVLDRLDRLVQGFDMAQIATAVYGRLILDRDGGMLLFCNAGHPPPLLRLPDGRVRQLDAADSRLIGVSPDEAAPRSEAGVLVPAGSTLLLYTDGLVERKPEDLTDGVERLRTAFEQLPDATPPDAVCDRLLAAVLPCDPDDDVALLVVRVR